MIRYTVTYSPAAEDLLAQLWIDSENRTQIAVATNEIDKLLSSNPAKNSTHLSEGLYRVEIKPLLVHFVVEEQDRRVTVWSVQEIL